MKKSVLDYKVKYYELRRTAKELIFENSAYQNEILECQKMIAQRERERELLLQHLLQYEQEAWELQSEMNNAHNEKHKLLKKQQEADKRKRVRLDTHLAEAAAIAQTEPDGAVSKIPKIKIVFQHKGAAVAPSNSQDTDIKLNSTSNKLQSVPAIDMNSEAKTAIKNKIKRNKLDPIVISLPSSSMLSKDPLQQQTVKRPRPSNLGINLTPSSLLAASSSLTPSSLLAASRSGLMLSPSMLPSSSAGLLSSQPSIPGFSPSIDFAELLARAADHTPTRDHTPREHTPHTPVYSETDTSCTPSPASIQEERLALEEAAVRALRTQVIPTEGDLAAIGEHYSMLNTFKRPSDVQGGFRISPSALRSIKQKIDSINNNQTPWKTAAKNMKSPGSSSTHSSSTHTTHSTSTHTSSHTTHSTSTHTITSTSTLSLQEPALTAAQDITKKSND